MDKTIMKYYTPLLLATVILLGSLTCNVNAAWYWKPGFPDYCPNGVPDFDQKQNGWGSIIDGGNGKAETTADPTDVQVTPTGPCAPYSLIVSMGPDGKLTTTPGGDDYFLWDYCGPTAVADCLWWLDSEFDPSSLVESYGAWDDHDPSNVQPLISDLAKAMDTDAQRTLGTGPHGWFSGTYLDDMENAIDSWLIAKGLDSRFSRTTIEKPTFEQVELEVEAGNDVILLLGFWILYEGQWYWVGGHYVTVAGVDSENNLIAFSDPFYDKAAPSLPSHNDAQYVSHDTYHVVPTTSPGGVWGPEDYGSGSFTSEDLKAFFGANPSPLIAKNPKLKATSLPTGGQGQPEVVTEVGYAVVISPRPAPPPPRAPSYPVGGAFMPVNKLAILSPYMALIGLASIAAVLVKKRKR